MQGHSQRSENADSAGDKLFSYVNEEWFRTSKSTETFVSLLDNYERETGKEEDFSDSEKREMTDFLEYVTDTDVMKYTLELLKAELNSGNSSAGNRRLETIVKSAVGHLRTKDDFENLLYDLWFAPYRRKAKNDSSAFEHVFVGEEKSGKVVGLHNWIQFYLEETKGNIDYLGWAGKQDKDWSDGVNLVTVKFKQEDADDGDDQEQKVI